MRAVATMAARLGPARPWRGLACVLGAVLLLGACGGGGEAEKKKTLWPGGDPAPAKKEEAPKAEIDEANVLGENPKWKPIAPLFETYAKQGIEGITNPMLPGLVRFVEKPIIEQPLDTATSGATDEGPAVDPLDPLTKAPLDKYKLIILVTGVAQPKAVVLDLDGHKHALVRGDALGKEGGRIEAILEFKMLVSVPGQAKPVEVSIAPPMSELENEAGREDSGI